MVSDDEESLFDSIIKMSDDRKSIYVFEDEFLAPLLDEIRQIESESIQSFVRAVLLNTDIFWLIPSSFSSQYHPPDEHNDGGNVLHTKRVFRVTKLLADSYGYSGIERDIILAAAIIHDVTKGVAWDDEGEPNYDPMHPYTVDKFVRQINKVDEIRGMDGASSTLEINSETLGKILRCVRCHMGPWSAIPETVPQTMPETILHFADLISSELHHIVDGDEVVMGRWIVDESNS